MFCRDVAGRDIYERRRPGDREDRDRDGRLAIGMDRIREEFGWPTSDGEHAGAGGTGMEADDDEHPRAAAWSDEVQDDDMGDGGDESRAEQDDQDIRQGTGQWLQVHGRRGWPPHGGSVFVDIRNFGDGVS